MQIMKIQYDKDADAINVRLSNDKIVESEEIKEDVIVDYNEKDEIVSVEILNVKTKSNEIEIPTILKSA